MPPQWGIIERQAFLMRWSKLYPQSPNTPIAAPSAIVGSSNKLPCLQPSVIPNITKMSITCENKGDQFVMDMTSPYPIPKINSNYVSIYKKSNFGSSWSPFFMIFMIILAIFIFYMLKKKGIIKF